MRFSEARRHPVVVTTTATTAARVEAFVVGADPGRVLALRLGKVDGDGTLLSWEDLTAFGRDAVTVAGIDVVRDARDAEEERTASKDLELAGKRALSERGVDLGTVRDVDFDTDTGRITTVITEREELAGSRLIGLGAYAAVFADPA